MEDTLTTTMAGLKKMKRNYIINTTAKFILSTWHHSEFRENDMMARYWNEFNVSTKDHFYHNGGSIENRHSIVEALIFNFDLVEPVEINTLSSKTEPSLFDVII